MKINMIDLGDILQKDSKEVKTILKNLKSKTIIKHTWIKNKEIKTSMKGKDFLEYFKDNYDYIEVTKFNNNHYSFRDNFDFYDISESNN